MKKPVKILLWLVGALFALIIAAVLTVALWLGPIVKTALVAVVPGVTETDYKLESIGLNPFSGTFSLREMHLSNPAGYTCREALGVNTVNVEIAVGELLGGAVHFRNVELIGAFASYVVDDAGTNNLERILANVKRHMPMSEKKADETTTAQEKTAETTAEKEPVKIDRLHISGVRLQFRGMPTAIAFPPITLKNLGGKKGGTWESIGNEIAAAWTGGMKLGTEAFTALSLFSGKALTNTNEALSKGAAATADALKKVGVPTEKVGKGVEATKQLLGKGAASTTESLGKGKDATAKAIGKGVDAIKNLGKGGDAVKGLGKGADAVKDGAKKLGGLLGL